MDQSWAYINTVAHRYMNVEIKTEPAQFLFGESRKSNFLCSVLGLCLAEIHHYPATLSGRFDIFYKTKYQASVLARFFFIRTSAESWRVFSLARVTCRVEMKMAFSIFAKIRNFFSVTISQTFPFSRKFYIFAYFTMCKNPKMTSIYTQIFAKNCDIFTKILSHALIFAKIFTKPALYAKI